MGNTIKTFQVYVRDSVDENNPWSEILSAVMFTIRSTYYTTLEETSMQLVLGKNIILPIFRQAD